MVKKLGLGCYIMLMLFLSIGCNKIKCVKRLRLEGMHSNQRSEMTLLYQNAVMHKSIAERIKFYKNISCTRSKNPLNRSKNNHVLPYTN